MPSSFFGLNIASSALSAFQAAVNTTANNVSNVQTEGYTRQVANRTQSLSLRVNQKYGTTGTGVETTSITQIRNNYYDVKYWNNNSSLELYNNKLTYMNQIENYLIDDDSEKGFSSLYADMFNKLDSLASNAADATVRNSFISSAQTLTTYFGMVSTGLTDIQEDCNEQIKSIVDNINSIAEKISALNKQINSVEIQGGYANELRDQRALLVDELSGIVPIEATETKVTNSNDPDSFVGATSYVVKINGQKLVDNYKYNTLECTSREQKINQTDIEGLYEVKWTDSSSKLNLSSNTMTGSLKALYDIRDGNNADNFRGKVTGVGTNSITVDPATMKTLESMTMNNEGYITVANQEFAYDSVTANLDGKGNIVSYTFELTESMDVDTMKSVSGAKAEIGESIETMGIPYYMAQLSEFVRSFTQKFNAIQQSGYDLNGKQMGSFFVGDAIDGSEFNFDAQTLNIDGTTSAASISTKDDSYYWLTAGNLTIADASLRDPTIFATTADQTLAGTDAHDLIDAMKKLQSDTVMYRGTNGGDFLQCLISDVTVDTQEAKIFQKNYSDISSTITGQRLSISGVDEDEEALNLVKYQNAYNLASRMIQTMSEMYDRLITQTGV